MEIGPQGPRGSEAGTGRYRIGANFALHGRLIFGNLDPRDHRTRPGSPDDALRRSRDDFGLRLGYRIFVFYGGEITFKGKPGLNYLYDDDAVEKQVKARQQREMM